MTGCGFCTKAKKMFAHEISSGEIIVVDSSKAPKTFRGFPTFTYNGKHYSGLPSSKKELYSKLGYHKESFTAYPPQPDPRSHARTPTPFIGVW